MTADTVTATVCRPLIVTTTVDMAAIATVTEVILIVIEAMGIDMTTGFRHETAIAATHHLDLDLDHNSTTAIVTVVLAVASATDVKSCFRLFL